MFLVNVAVYVCLCVLHHVTYPVYVCVCVCTCVCVYCVQLINYVKLDSVFELSQLATAKPDVRYCYCASKAIM